MTLKKTKRTLNGTGSCTKPRTDGFKGAGASATCAVAEVNNYRMANIPPRSNVFLFNL